MPADPTVLSALVIAAGSLAVALVTRRGNQKAAAETSAISARVVDRDDFKAVVEELRASLSTMKGDLAEERKRVTRLDDRLEAEVSAREKAEERAVRAEERASRAEERADELEARVALLEAVLEENDIKIPPRP